MKNVEGSSVYERVTNHIVAAIEEGTEDFVMPWHRQNNGGLPMNAATKKTYQGVNAVLLWSVARQLGYASPYWATYLQWSELGAQVRKGESASPVVFYRPCETQADANEDEEQRGVLRRSSAFNATQVEGWTPPHLVSIDLPKPIDAVESFVETLGATVIHGFNRAAYYPTLDRIQMPDVRAFVATSTGAAIESYYAVLLHEHVHWSGHETRLNRDLSGRFGTSSYAMEELVAELGAAFLCADLGLSAEPRPDHAAYIDTWLKVLREQPSAIFASASIAAAASRYLHGLAGSSRSNRASTVV